MARKMTEWPSKRGPITKIMPSDGCIGDTVPLAVGKWYEFHEFGWHMGNVGLEFFCLTPLPGSEDHKRLSARDAWMDPDMNKYDLEHVTTGHALMSAEDWSRAYKLAWETYLPRITWRP